MCRLTTGLNCDLTHILFRLKHVSHMWQPMNYSLLLSWCYLLKYHCSYNDFVRWWFTASCHCPPNFSSQCGGLLTRFELRGLVWFCMLLHQHHVQDAEGVLNPEDRPVAPGCSKNHQPAETSFGWDESGSVVALLHVRSRGQGRQGRLAPGLDQLHGAVLRRDFALAARRPIILGPLCFSGSISLLHLRSCSRLLRPGHLAGRLRLTV